MGITLASNFDVNAALPLDSRMVVADITARDAIVAGRRYLGMTVYVVADTITYQLKAGILNADWVEYGGGGSAITYVETFSGDGIATVFSLANDPLAIENTQVYINGVYQQKTAAYTLATTDVTFTAAPPTGTDNIEVIYTTPTSTAVIPDGAITTAKIADGSITDAKLNLTMFTKPVAYTPTWTGVGTPITSTLWWKRDNSEIIIWGTMTSGTVSTNAITFTLPSGLTIDTTKFLSSPVRSHSFGTGKRLLSDVAAFLNYNDAIRSGVFAVVYNGSNTPQIADNSFSSTFGDVNGSTILSSGDSLNIEQVRIPIAEWA